MQMHKTQPMTDRLNCPSGWRTLRRNKREDRKPKAVLMSQSGCALATSEGPRDSIRLLIVTNARVLLYHPYKQSLCQAHYRATNDFIS